MDEIAAGLHHLDDIGADRHGRDGQVTRRQPLGHCDDVGLYAHGFMAPHVAGATEAANDLVADHQYAIFAANRLDLRPVIGGRNDNSTCALHWLTNEGGNIFGANFKDFGLNGFRTGSAKRLGRHVAAFIMPIRLADMLDAGDGIAADIVHRLHPAQANTCKRGTMIGVDPADECLPFRLALEFPILPDKTEYGVIGFAARAVEENMRQAATRQAGDFVSQ